jgi:hypothetical protein
MRECAGKGRHTVTRWYERPAVLDYIVEAYQGTEEHGKRQFVWEDPATGDVLIGNSRAFTDHLAARFGLDLTATSWSGLHEAMRMLGEVAKPYTARSAHRGQRFHNQAPEARVIRRGDTL